MTVDRRESLRAFGAFVAGAGTAPSQPQSAGGPETGLLAPVLELVNATEFESMARLVLPPARYQSISGGHRRSFDKMTFRQRLMVYAMDLDLTTELFGYEMFAPIIVGPVANQGAARGRRVGNRARRRGGQGDHGGHQRIKPPDRPNCQRQR